MATSTSDSVGAAAPHHRHPFPTTTQQPPNNDGDESITMRQTSEDSPLVAKKLPSWAGHGHLSMVEGDEGEREHPSKHKKQNHSIICGLLILLCLVASVSLYRGATGKTPPGIGTGISRRRHHHPSAIVVSVEDANEHWLDIGNGLQIWFRTWGRPDGIPIVFIHGGPGNAIADYFGNSNKRFFDDANHTYFVVEIDQRGTGKSQPSVRDDWKNMKHYQDISIDKMCDDFEQVRDYLGIDEWLVWGGSFGSTLAINYGERYPESCMALILRGIYLDTAEELYAVYSRQSYLDHPKRLREFDILYDYAAQYVQRSTTTGNHEDDHHSQQQQQIFDPNDAERLLRVYAEMIADGDRYAIWHWFVFENNLMEIDPQYILDPDKIDNQFYRESLSVAFFETHLWLHGSFDEPTSDLMNPDKIDKLTMPMWICQGQHDEVCPPKYARRFADAVEAKGKSPRVVSRFLNATHEDTDPAIEECLQWSLKEFAASRRSPL